jgi:glycosyltransferase involved in cell wall biosynthesis
MPDVSVVIPTRSRSGMLAQALRSVLSQRDVDLEVIVVDDGSTDDTAAMVTAMTARRVHLIRQETAEGVSAARNRGIAAAAGRWVAFLDDDDLWAPDKLVRQLEAATAAGRRWVYAGDVNVDSDLRVLDGGPPPAPDQVVSSLERYNAVPSGASNVMVRRDLLAAAGPFDPQLQTSEDWDMWIRLARRGPPSWVCSPLVALRIHSGSASFNMPKVLEEIEVVAARYSLAIDRARHLRWTAWTYLQGGKRRQALRYYGRAIALGDYRSAARAAVALIKPSVGSLPSKHPASSWTAEAQVWISKMAGTDPV